MLRTIVLTPNPPSPSLQGFCCLQAARSGAEQGAAGQTLQSALCWQLLRNPQPGSA